MVRLCVNADDFGVTEEQNKSIAELWCAGRITSASIMVVTKAFPHAIELAKKHKMRVGLHLVLTNEAAIEENYSPVSGHKCLTLDGDGKRFPHVFFVRFRGFLKEIQDEALAQYEKLLATGIRPTHVDAHMYCVPQYDSSLEHALDPLYEKHKIRFVDYQKGKISDLVTQRRMLGWRGIGGERYEFKLIRWRRLMKRLAAGTQYGNWVHVHCNSTFPEGTSRREEYKLLMSNEYLTRMKENDVKLWYLRPL